jgi:hypothetical protein
MRTLRAAALGLLLLAACNKPEADDCRKALQNMQEILGTDQMKNNVDIESEVRRCKGGSSKESVACAMAAKTLPELQQCNFMGTGKHKKDAEKKE